MGIGRFRRPGRHLLLEFFPVDVLLRLGDEPGRFDELGELVVGDFGCIHPESADRHLVGGFLDVAGERVGIRRSHHELAARDPHHSRWRLRLICGDDADETEGEGEREQDSDSHIRDGFEQKGAEEAKVLIFNNTRLGDLCALLFDFSFRETVV